MSKTSKPVASSPPVDNDQADEVMREFARTLVRMALARHASGQRWDRDAQRWRHPS
jgi:hypothetical protein